MILELTKEDIEAILYALGKLPTETNVYPLGIKIRQQIPVEESTDAVSPE